MILLSEPAALAAWALCLAALVAWIRARLAASEALGAVGAAKVEEQRQKSRAERAEHDGLALRQQVAALEEHVQREQRAADAARADAADLRRRAALDAKPGAVRADLAGKFGK